MTSSIELDSQRPFAGRYRVVRRIAAGGMGAVFEVVHIETQRRRALKVMLPELVSNQALRDRFQMEARITANVDSEYIVDVFDAGVDDVTAMPFLVMELLNGEELGETLKRGPLLATQVISYLRQVASALDKTHAAGIVHRDLKPENLFLTHREDGTPRIKILDFGISKVVNEASPRANATRNIGTPLYMAPEQVLGQGVSPAADLYSLGLIAYTLLVGEPYWQQDADKFENAISFVLHTTKGVSESAHARATALGRKLPQGFDAWFQRATDLDPTKRFRRASELVSELGALFGVEAGPHSAASPLANTPATPAGAEAVTLLAAGTAPGTELEPGASGGAPRRSSARPLLLGLAALAVLALAAGALLRSSSPLSSTPEPVSAARAVAPPPVSAEPSVAPALVPLTSGASTAPEVAPVPSASAAPSSVLATPSHVTAASKAPKTKTASGAAKAPAKATNAAGPSYTRD